MKSFLQVTNYILLFVIILTVPGVVLSQGNTSTQFSPPIVSIELSNVEPRPSGVAEDTTFGGGAGGVSWRDFLPDPVDQPEWDHVPDHFSYPTDFFLWEYRACGFPSGNVEGTLIAPNGDSFSVAGDYEGNGCWYFNAHQQSNYELGQYTFQVAGSTGNLSYTGIVGLPSCPIEAGIVLMGFPQNAALTIHFYWTDYNTINYIATRTVNTDNTGAVILKVDVARSSPFWGYPIDIGIQGYRKEQRGPFEARYFITNDSTCIDERSPYISAPRNIDEARQYESVWSNLEFIDMTSPGSQSYQAIVVPDQIITFGFTWCGDTAARKQEILEPLSVAFFIDQSEIIPDSILIADDRTCRRWVTLLSGWELGTSMALEVRYSLSKRIFDGTSYYEAGDYIQRIVVHVQQ